MRNLKNPNLKTIDNEKLDDQKALDFIKAGIGCNCLLTLSESGVLDKLLHEGHLNVANLKQIKSPTLIKSAIQTLISCKILEINDLDITMTEFGLQLSHYLGLVSMLFEGYGGLLSNQNAIWNKIQRNPIRLINGVSISKAAVKLAQNFIDPVVASVFSALKFRGTICDLGCGYGRMLSMVCKLTSNPGLGFDSETSVVKFAKLQSRGTSVDIELGNICNLKGVWEDVVCLMQCHVFHDFTPSSRCVKLLNSYLKNFPNMQYFIYIDTVSPTYADHELLPGFDYVHGLLGIETRSYQQTIKMFEQSYYTAVNEMPIHGLPNTYLWLLRPKHIVKKSQA